MENTRGKSNYSSLFPEDWSKEQAEELAMLYLEDYYRTMDDSFLMEAIQLSKDEQLDIQKIMHRARARLA